MEKRGKKQIHFEVDQELFEEFHRLFPGWGEKKSFFTQVMEIAVEKGRKRFADEVMEEWDG